MLATLDHIETLSPHIRTYWFRPGQPFRHVAGEFTELYVPHADTDERGDRRWFTISSSPSEPLIGITTRFEARDGSSFKRALQRLRPGEQVSLAEPMGDFVLPKDKTIPLVFVAGGLGITPIHSIVSYLATQNEQRTIQLFRAAASPAEEIFARELQQYPLVYHCFYASGGQRLTADNILLAIQDTSLVYLSGPEGFIQKLSADLQKNGVQKRRIITDLFPGYPASLA